VCSNCNGARFQPLGAGIGRIVDDIKRLVGGEVGRVADGRLVTVGSERDLIGVRDIGLAVAVDVDGVTMAPHYRAAEDALRLLVRLAQTVQRGGGHRCLVQTSVVKQEVVEALIRGRSAAFLERELMSRRKFGFPPVGSLIAIESDGEHDAESLLADGLSGIATVLGPAGVRDRLRWLIQGRDLEQARLALRPILTTLRGRGAKVRVDVDPIDL
jgi:primosomal protein N'